MAKPGISIDMKQFGQDLKEFEKKLKFMRESGQSAVYLKLVKNALRVHAKTVKSIAKITGSDKGKRYSGQRRDKTGPRGGKYREVIVSDPGTPPNTDQGGLIESYGWEADKATLEARVGSNLAYARALELGLSSRGLDPRPHLRPAFLQVVKNEGGSFEVVEKDGKVILEFRERAK